MSENYSLKELNEWADKVIDCISKWADEMNKAFNGTPTSIKIEKLDFSEHDKVFEDKIEDLQQRIRELIKEKDEYKRKCNNFGFENQELKQRIAELESKEIKNPINGWICVAAKEINGQEYVRLEDFMRVVNDFQEKNKLEDDGK